MSVTEKNDDFSKILNDNAQIILIIQKYLLQ